MNETSATRIQVSLGLVSNAMGDLLGIPGAAGIYMYRYPIYIYIYLDIRCELNRLPELSLGREAMNARCSATRERERVKKNKLSP